MERPEKAKKNNLSMFLVKEEFCGPGKMVAAPDELPGAESPMVFTSGRLLEHWHTGATTRQAPDLDPIGKIPEFKFCAARVETR